MAQTRGWDKPTAGPGPQIQPEAEGDNSWEGEEQPQGGRGRGGPVWAPSSPVRTAPAGTGVICAPHMNASEPPAASQIHQSRPPAKLQPHQPFITIIKKKRENYKDSGAIGQGAEEREKSFFWVLFPAFLHQQIIPCSSTR